MARGMLLSVSPGFLDELKDTEVIKKRWGPTILGLLNIRSQVQFLFDSPILNKTGDRTF